MVIVRNKWYKIRSIEALEAFYKGEDPDSLSGNAGRSLLAKRMEKSVMYANKDRGYCGVPSSHMGLAKEVTEYFAENRVSLGDIYE